LIHQASAGFEGTAADIEVRAREILRMNARLQEMMAADTGQSVGREGRTPTASRDVICQRTDRYGRLGRKCMSVISAIASLGSA
jgi:ATP-dependent Clp protease protease subunit